MRYEWLVDEELMLSDCEKSRYLLPEGCMDLNDVIALEERASALARVEERPASPPSNEMPFCITIPDSVAVGDLAGLLHLKPYKLISALIQFHVFASVKSEVTYETASMVCAYLGVAVKKADEA